MVGLVLVSHSRTLALAAQEMVRSMTGPKLPLAIAAGAGDEHKELGTDAVEISEAILSVKSPDGVLVLMDMGSAILSAETALDLMDEATRPRIQFCAAPFVEGAVAAGVTANLGAPLEEVYREALSALDQKKVALQEHALPGEKSASAKEPAPAQGSASTAAQKTARVTILNPHGLHARPAARLIQETKTFKSEISVRNVTNGRGPVSVRSLSGLASLEILQGNEIELGASGEDADAALANLLKLIKGGLGETVSSPGKAVATQAKTKPAPAQKSVSATGAVPISEGIAMGPSFYFHEAGFEIPQTKAENPEAEIARLEKAVAATREALQKRTREMTATVGAANAGIYEAQGLALQDPDLVDEARRAIRNEHDNAARAWSRASEKIIARYRALSDPYLRERAVDLEDVGQQVLALLAERRDEGLSLMEPAVLVADDLTPHQVSTLPKKMILGVVLLDGGPTAHSAILLRALGIPAVVQARGLFVNDDLSQSPPLALNGATGEVWVRPNEALLSQLHKAQAEFRQRAEEEKRSASLPGETRDGERIEIFANIGQAEQAESALQAGAEGIGLLRTEFLFLDRDSAPTEEEQIEALCAVAAQMKEKTVIVRTLDAGGDKELSYLPMPEEQNPFLGVRALRLCLAQPDLFHTQLRAILRAGEGQDFRIMFPMIANVDDLKAAQKALTEAHAALEKEGISHQWPIETGIMIEIPAAAVEAEALAEQAHFFSIGTNDLTQYTLAADRGNPALAAYQDALHPAVLQLIAMVTAGAHKHGRLVAVCGEAAGDEKAAAILVGLGVRELSMTAARIGRVKAALRKRTLKEFQDLAQSALKCRSAAEVRALVTTL
jgi:phosphocarrier protein FPr